MAANPRISASREFRARRRAFEKERGLALAAQRKGTRWRKKSAWLYCETDGVFVDTLVTAHVHEDRTSVRTSAKPMGLDSLYWRISGMPENEKAPLSLRANGVFTCWGLVVRQEVLEDPADAETSAAHLLAAAESGAQTGLSLLAEAPFSRVLEERAGIDGRLAAERFGMTYVTALILDERLDDAMRVLDARDSGALRTFHNHDFGGPEPDQRYDFFALARKHIATLR